MLTTSSLHDHLPSPDTRSAHQDRLDIVSKTRSSVMPWRGQFSPQLIDYLIERNASRAELIVDPFCGSGTVLYEAASHNISSIAFDINPAAVCLAEFSAVCTVEPHYRNAVITEFSHAISHFSYLDDTLSIDQAATHLASLQSSDIVRTAVRAALLLSFGNQRTTTFSKVLRSAKTIETAIKDAPFTKREIAASLSDARDLNVGDGSADYILTSPPYINVFNYHQNYRPITEGLGYAPLPMARAEIGANRKYRQNRYMTVVQYSIDMALYFQEAHRILRDSGCMTIVLGRESNVRGVPFQNGKIIADIAGYGLGWQISQWDERKFMNRFGDLIFEDILTLTPPKNTVTDCESVGREVGVGALTRSLAYAPKERRSEIEEAASCSATIPASPYVLREAV